VLEARGMVEEERHLPRSVLDKPSAIHKAGAR
jgi:hypothetical protein